MWIIPSKIVQISRFQTFLQLIVINSTTKDNKMHL